MQRPAFVAASVAIPVTFELVRRELVPMLALVAMVIFAARTFALLVIVRPAWRARTVGMMEAIMGSDWQPRGAYKDRKKCAPNRSAREACNSFFGDIGHR